MKTINWLKNLFGDTPTPVNEPELVAPDGTNKNIATSRGEPWVGIKTVELDPNNPNLGSFDLDWNDIFIARLVKAGYFGKTDQQIVDMWFKTICQNVADETYEQEMADPEKREKEAERIKNLGNGRREIS